MLVTGPPCAGKTTVAERLAAGLAAPLFSKDGFKVPLFDALGWGGRAESRRADAAAYAALFYAIERQISAGRAFVAESNFKPSEHAAVFRRLMGGGRAEALQVVCQCPTEILRERFQARASNAERHPGHCDALLLDGLPEMLARGGYGPLDLPGELVTLDTSDLAAVDHAALLAKARGFLARPGHCQERGGGG